jgi:hypothetical protein
MTNPMGGIPHVETGISQVFPAHGPEGSGLVHNKIITVATISLSATGSRKAPNADVTPYTAIFVGKGLSHTL